MVRAMGSVPQSQTTMSAMLIMLATSAVFVFDGGCAVALLFILVCGEALLQSRLIEAAGVFLFDGGCAVALLFILVCGVVPTSLRDCYRASCDAPVPQNFSICAIRARAQQQHVETKGVAPATAFLSKCLVPTSLRDCYRASCDAAI